MYFQEKTFKRKGQGGNSPSVSQSELIGSEGTKTKLKRLLYRISSKCSFNPKLTVFVVLQARNDL
jgi:hypothetical protein